MIRINIGELFLQLKADSSQLVTGLDQAQNKVSKSAEAMAAKLAGIGKTMTVVGGVVTAAFGAIIMKTTQLGDTYDKMSKRTNIAVEDLSALGYAAKISGADLDTVEKSLRYLARGINDASQGVGEAKEAFKELNISVTDTAGNLRPTMDVLKEAATKLAAMTDETKQVALATDIFGARYGTQLLPMLKQGGEGIEALMKKAKELGIVMSTEAAAKAAEFNDRLTDLKESFGAAGRNIGEILIPPLTRLAEKVINIIQKIKTWADAHKPLVEMIVKIGAMLGVLAAVGGPILLAVSAFMKMQVAITAVSIAIKALAITSGPIGWLILAVGALYVAWETNFGGIRDFTLAVVGKVTEALGWLWNKIKWVLEKLGLYKETAKEVVEANNELGDAAKGIGEKADTAATGVDILATSMYGLETNIDNAKEALDEFGNKIETFDEWVARLAEETAKTNKKMADEAETAYKRYTDAMQPIEDRLYELTHTEEEVAAKKLQLEREKAEASVKGANLGVEKTEAALNKIKEVYDKEIALIIAKIEEKKQAEIKSAEQTEKSASVQKTAIKTIVTEYDKLIDKIEAVGRAAEEAAKKLAFEKWEAANPITPEEKAATEARAEAYKTPSYASGTLYVPRTEMAMVHKGERIIPPNQNINNNSYSPSIVINISGNGNSEEIKQAIKQALAESTRQFNRSGSFLIPGMA